ncbi:hypothetical protein [Leptospira sp. GIMC2001]|uniref:hypothetical protein n=1 Tax=Leptospira sp. GIMC2001 TaxID=1513297 RepID=UPI00234B158B|nr:hypothetical protein [Leptospira sp. GIMC2001]WCL47754.1 hypothetical protein O4O04_00420 [Leptospira sp. GIMC2001]
MTNNKKIIWIIISVLIISIIASLGFLLYKQYGSDDKPEWSQNKSSSYASAELNQKPILIAMVEYPCGEEPKGNPCPLAETIPDLKDFVLLEVIKNSQEFHEFTYDDRFQAELEQLPKFFLLNPSGELRDVQEIFPKGELLARWKRIR